jgi:hypothetical protein
LAKKTLSPAYLFLLTNPSHYLKCMHAWTHYDLTPTVENTISTWRGNAVDVSAAHTLKKTENNIEERRVAHG